MPRGRPVDTREPFEVDLAELLAERIRGDRKDAVAVYDALCNVEWERNDGRTYSCTWRGASELIAGIREQGEHDLEFYYSGTEGFVAGAVEEALAARGWRHHPYSSVTAA
jgi:hypothetical protein